MNRSQWWIPALFFFGGLGMAFHPMIFSGFSFTQVDPGDSRLINYILEHTYTWLIGATERGFWSPPVFYPVPDTLAQSDILLGVAPFYWIWRGVGFFPETSYQLWLLTLSLLNFGSFYFLANRTLRLGALPAAMGAFLFSFGAPRIAQLQHSQLLGQFFVVLGVIAWVEIFRTSRDSRFHPARWIALAVASAVGQLYAGFYWGWFYGVLLFVVLVVALTLKEPRRRMLEVFWNHKWTFLGMGAAGGALLLPMVIPYLEAAAQSGMRDFQSEVFWGMPNLQAWGYVGPDSWLYGWTTRIKLFRMIPNEHEARLGIGLFTAIFTGIGFYRYRSFTWVRVAFFTGLILFLFSTVMPNGFTFWKGVYEFFPGAQAVRAVSRLGVFLLLFAGIGVALFFEDCFKRKSAKWVFVLMGICVLEQGQTTPSYHKLEQREDAERIVQAIPDHCSFFFYSPVGPEEPGEIKVKAHLDAMWAQMISGVPTVNGYSGNFPPLWGDLFSHRLNQPKDETRIRKALTRWMSAHQLSGGEDCWIRIPRSKNL